MAFTILACQQQDRSGATSDDVNDGADVAEGPDEDQDADDASDEGETPDADEPADAGEAPDADETADAGEDADDAMAGPACAPAETHEGEGTYYAATGGGNCSFPPTPDDLMVAALNTTDYADSALCGACIEVTGPQGAVQVRVVDRCPGCSAGDVDLSQEAFAQIAEVSAGRVPISWRVVPCEVDGPLKIHFKEGSNIFWSAVQVRDHRHPIVRLEYLDDDTDAFVEVERLDYNYFVRPSGGFGDSPYTLRVTDIHGGAVVTGGLAFAEDTVVNMDTQLPACVSE